MYEKCVRVRGPVGCVCVKSVWAVGGICTFHIVSLHFTHFFDKFLSHISHTHSHFLHILFLLSHHTQFSYTLSTNNHSRNSLHTLFMCPFNTLLHKPLTPTFHKKSLLRCLKCVLALLCVQHVRQKVSSFRF